MNPNSALVGSTNLPANRQTALEDLAHGRRWLRISSTDNAVGRKDDNKCEFFAKDGVLPSIRKLAFVIELNRVRETLIAVRACHENYIAAEGAVSGRNLGGIPTYFHESRAVFDCRLEAIAGAGASWIRSNLI